MHFANAYFIFCWLRQLLARTFAEQTFSLRNKYIAYGSFVDCIAQ